MCAACSERASLLVWVCLSAFERGGWRTTARARAICAFSIYSQFVLPKALCPFVSPRRRLHSLHHRLPWAPLCELLWIAPHTVALAAHQPRPNNAHARTLGVQTSLHYPQLPWRSSIKPSPSHVDPSADASHSSRGAMPAGSRPPGGRDIYRMSDTPQKLLPPPQPPRTSPARGAFLPFPSPPFATPQTRTQHQRCSAPRASHSHARAPSHGHPNHRLSV